MAKIRRSGKTITIKFDNKRESSSFLRAAGFKSVPDLQNNPPEHTGTPYTCKHPDCVKYWQQETGVDPGKPSSDHTAVAYFEDGKLVDEEIIPPRTDLGPLFTSSGEEIEEFPF